MKILVMALAMGVAAPAQAAEPQAQALQLRPKAGLALAPTHSSAPFVVHPASEPEIEFSAPQPAQQGGSNFLACNGGGAVCYDATNGRIEVPSARNYMPEIPGLKRETISVRRDRIIFKYTF